MPYCPTPFKNPPVSESRAVLFLDILSVPGLRKALESTYSQLSSSVTFFAYNINNLGTSNLGEKIRGAAASHSELLVNML